MELADFEFFGNLDEFFPDLARVLSFSEFEFFLKYPKISPAVVQRDKDTVTWRVGPRYIKEQQLNKPKVTKDLKPKDVIELVTRPGDYY